MFTLVRGGEVWALEAVGRKEILICGERILAMGEGLAPKAEALGRVEVLDASGKFVVPGFIDQHIHFLGGGDFEGPLGRVPELHLSMITRGGVTTAVGCLGIDMDFKNLHGLLVKAHELERSGLTTYIYTGSFQIPTGRAAAATALGGPATAGRAGPRPGLPARAPAHGRTPGGPRQEPPGTDADRDQTPPRGAADHLRRTRSSSSGGTPSGGVRSGRTGRLTASARRSAIRPG